MQRNARVVRTLALLLIISIVVIHWNRRISLSGGCGGGVEEERTQVEGSLAKAAEECGN